MSTMISEESKKDNPTVLIEIYAGCDGKAPIYIPLTASLRPDVAENRMSALLVSKMGLAEQVDRETSTIRLTVRLWDHKNQTFKSKFFVFEDGDTFSIDGDEFDLVFGADTCQRTSDIQKNEIASHVWVLQEQKLSKAEQSRMEMTTAATAARRQNEIKVEDEMLKKKLRLTSGRTTANCNPGENHDAKGKGRA